MPADVRPCVSEVRGAVERRAFVVGLCAATIGAVAPVGAATFGRRRLPPQIDWTASDFRALVGTWFEVVGPTPTGGWLRLESVETVGRPGAGGPSGRAPFALTFAGGADGPREQETYSLRSAATGEITLLLAPVDRPRAAPRFEAVVG